ncbi:MAG: AI-2E family transporter, partial [Myxococcales bacterium]|nr:AI-2E family transporter [Myxococcales bacterium]
MVSSASPKPIPRWILWIAGIAALGMAMYGLRGVLTPVFFAFLIAYALSPIVDRLEGRRVPRAAGATVVLVGAPLLVTIGLLFAAPRVAQDIGAFASVIPERLDALLEGAAPRFEERGIALPRSTSQLVGQSDIDVQGMAEG